MNAAQQDLAYLGVGSHDTFLEGLRLVARYRYRILRAAGTEGYGENDGGDDGNG
ncbi:hypothetical protein [Jidongwangia harbinensis]|uniref:hypothetical protein n=1 Tax=Jidongwangia harbinensis TaxID=2878561 RepID=UPI001CD923A9|nr:hypothetical protein [Jidongwangia harbinensis]MCA2219015.1 hypothetical protein [Jidongwangia harbinensis]